MGKSNLRFKTCFGICVVINTNKTYIYALISSRRFFMVNYNGTVLDSGVQFLNQTNRGLKYGDGVFETFRVVNSEILLWEEHYLRLMSAMRILRMEIPMNFTMEFLSEEVLKLIKSSVLEKGAVRIRLTVFRDAEGLYLPITNDVSYIIELSELQSPFYLLNTSDYEVELFKDFYVNADLLSTLKSTNRLINIVGSIFAKENGYQNCLLVNSKKNVVETLNGNLFLVKDNRIKTPPLSEGCINGIIRKQLIAIIALLPDYILEEALISPFELQKADELFTTNSIIGVQPITKYRKKTYSNKVAKEMLGKLNVKIRLSNSN